MRRVAIVALVVAALVAAACVRKVELHPDGAGAVDAREDSTLGGSDGGSNDDGGGIPDADLSNDAGGFPDAAIDSG